MPYASPNASTDTEAATHIHRLCVQPQVHDPDALRRVVFDIMAEAGHSHLLPVYRGKGTPPKKGGGSSYTVTKLPSSLDPKGHRLLSLPPLPLTLEPPENDHHLSFYFFPLNKKETQNLN